MNVTDFEMENNFYNKFLLSLDFKSITKLNKKINSTESLPITLNTLLNKLLSSLSKFKKMEENNFENTDEDLESENEDYENEDYENKNNNIEVEN